MFVILGLFLCLTSSFKLLLAKDDNIEVRGRGNTCGLWQRTGRSSVEGIRLAVGVVFSKLHTLPLAFLKAFPRSLHVLLTPQPCQPLLHIMFLFRAGQEVIVFVVQRGQMKRNS